MNNSQFQYCNSLTSYSRRKTNQVKIGDLWLGSDYPIRVQSMTTIDTMDTIGSVEQSIRMIESGCELVRITAPSVKEAQNLENIKNELRKRGYHTPLVADIHFTPNAAELAARIVEKVRINPGNYADKKRFEVIDYTDQSYALELERIRERFLPLIKICKEYGTAMRIGTNHGSLSDRILSRYGDTPLGMVESALEFLRICEDENYFNIVISMKSSNPQVMVQAYRLLSQRLLEENLKPYPLHLGVTEAGEGEDGRIKSSMGIGTLLEDGLGDTVRVSLTEDPEFEAPVARTLINRYEALQVRSSELGVGSSELEVGSSELVVGSSELVVGSSEFGVRSSELGVGSSELEVGSSEFGVGSSELEVQGSEFGVQSSEFRPSTSDFRLPTSDLRPSTSNFRPSTSNFRPPTYALPPSPYSPFSYQRRETVEIANFGEKNVPRVIADYSNFAIKNHEDLREIGHFYLPIPDKWRMNDLGADYVYSGKNPIPFMLPNGLKEIVDFSEWQNLPDKLNKFPYFQDIRQYSAENSHQNLNFVEVNLTKYDETDILKLNTHKNVVLVLTAEGNLVFQAIRNFFFLLLNHQIKLPVIIRKTYQNLSESDFHLYAATDLGGNFVEGFGDGIWLGFDNRTVANSTAFGILQAARTRMSKTEYISCPSCGRTLFDLQETTALIRKRTDHLKGIKIGIMGCIVNGPGEMADADYGYVGIGKDKIALYRGQTVVKKSVHADNAVNELIELIKEDNRWFEPESLNE